MISPSHYDLKEIIRCSSIGFCLVCKRKLVSNFQIPLCDYHESQLNDELSEDDD